MRAFALRKAQYQKFLNTTPVRMGEYGSDRAKLNKSADELASRAPTMASSVNITPHKSWKIKRFEHIEGIIGMEVRDVPLSAHRKSVENLLVTNNLLHDTNTLEA